MTSDSKFLYIRMSGVQMREAWATHASFFPRKMKYRTVVCPTLPIRKKHVVNCATSCVELIDSVEKRHSQFQIPRLSVLNFETHSNF